MRIGLGFDAHRLVEGRKLIIGGVEIGYHLGLDGHSDADVLAHAVSDAILGALRAGDIGKLFPSDDPAYEGANSIELLREVGELAAGKGYRVADIDSVISAEAPRLSKYRDQMRANIANALGIGIDSVGIKATTTEGMGYEGRGEGISAQAVVLLEEA
ncbi:MAG: 2-C-methyl-D-erythritol 2,4-cyclodiphosphate synthase [Coriobacteriales bacterium]|nr:2-C-methyl-D-erythritol 2,4-cyclodiphosphate synthase [Coriobacteriales bacterium]